MTIAAWVFVALAGLLHVYIFLLETVWIDRPAARATFGIRRDDLPVIRPWAFNQGFYNLFLAIGALLAVWLHARGDETVARTLGFFACGSMLAAALVLLGYDRSKAGAALKQGALPALAVALLLLT